MQTQESFDMFCQFVFLRDGGRRRVRAYFESTVGFAGVKLVERIDRISGSFLTVCVGNFRRHAVRHGLSGDGSGQ